MMSLKIYKGIYVPENLVLCVSEDKDLVKIYLTAHRKLSKGEYKIEKEIITGYEMHTKYEGLNLALYDDYFIPEIDISYINYYTSSSENDIKNIILALSKITKMIMELKKVPDVDKSTLLNAIKILNNIRKKKKLTNKLDRIQVRDNSILYCGIKEYLNTKNLYKTMICYDNTWASRCKEGDGDIPF